MNIKKQVIKNVKNKLEKEQGILRHNIFKNKFEMRFLAKVQTENKRELAILQKLIKSLETEVKK